MKFMFWISNFNSTSGILIVNDNIWCKRREFNSVIEWLKSYNVSYKTSDMAVREIEIDDPDNIYLALFVLDRESKET